MPHWVKHHRKIFPNAVLVDYHSTDKSVEIISKLAPTWRVITSSNRIFDASKVDEEIMKIEASVSGAKVVINTTDFLQLGPRDLAMIEGKLGSFEEFALEIPGVIAVQAHQSFPEGDQASQAKTAAAITRCIFNHSKHKLSKNGILGSSRPAKLLEYFQHGYIREMGNPQLRNKLVHSHKSGHYNVGRHSWRLPSLPALDSKAVHLGMYPWTQSFVDRKLAMRKAVPKRDLLRGRGLQHTLNLGQWERALDFWRNEITMHNCDICAAVPDQISFLGDYFGEKQ